MQDQLSQIYLESVASTPAKKDGFNKSKTVGTVKEGEDFDAKKKGFQKGTGPDAQKKSFKKAKNLKEDADMKDEQPIIGSQFDSLFNKTIKEDFEPADDSGEFGAPADDDMEFGGDDSELGSDDEEEGGETDLRSAISNIIEQLQDILSNVEGGDSEGEGDIEDMEGVEDSNDPEDDTEDEDPDTVEEADAGMTKERDGKLSAAPKNIKHLQRAKSGTHNKVGGYFGKKTMRGGTGDAGGHKERDGRLTPAPGYKELQGKSNRVQSGVPSRTGANLFD